MSDTHLPSDQTPADLSDWRERLLASLRDCGVEPAPRRAAWHWTVMIVGLTAILIVTLVGRAVVDEALRHESQAAVRWGIYVAWILFAVFVLSRLRNRFVRNAAQSRARSAEAELERPARAARSCICGPLSSIRKSSAPVGSSGSSAQCRWNRRSRN